MKTTATTFFILTMVMMVGVLLSDNIWIKLVLLGFEIVFLVLMIVAQLRQE